MTNLCNNYLLVSVVSWSNWIARLRLTRGFPTLLLSCSILNCLQSPGKLLTTKMMKFLDIVYRVVTYSETGCPPDSR